MRNMITLIAFVLLSAMKFPQEQIVYENSMLERVLKKADQSFDEWKALEIPEAGPSESTLHGKFFIHTSRGTATYAYLYVGRVFSCRAGGCSSAGPSNPEDASGEYFDYFMLFDAEAVVQEIRVFNYQATHGHEVSARGWLKQFIGHQAPQKLEVEKNIDAISGATISVYALTHDVDVKAALLAQLLENR